MRSSLSFIVPALLLCACGTENSWVPGDGQNDPDADPDFQFDIPGEELSPEVLGSINGVVFSPAISVQYRFPIPKALVYLDRMEPGLIPKKNYCDKCVTLPTNTPYDLTDSYGAFSIDHVPEGEWNLVVQKGQFRRVRRITVYGGQNTEIPSDMTSLPNRDDPGSMDTIPRIAVASGSYDWMEDLLAKFGLADLGADFHYLRGTTEFTLFSNGGRAFGVGIEDFRDFLRRPPETPDLDDLSDFNILFIPCTDDQRDEVLVEPDVIENLKTFVTDGGKLYVADWSYDYVEQAFPAFIDFMGDDAVIGNAEDRIAEFWDTTGTIGDADLSAWLAALGLVPNEINFLKNWAAVEGTATVPGEDEEHNPVDIVPAQMISGNVPGLGSKPLNVVFNYGCGKVLFTTYHTVGALETTPRPEMIPQEKILLYLVLDIGVCSNTVVIPI